MSIGYCDSCGSSFGHHAHCPRLLYKDEPKPTRTELIARLRQQECCQSHGGVGAAPGRCTECPRHVADMLEADGQRMDAIEKQLRILAWCMVG